MTNRQWRITNHAAKRAHEMGVTTQEVLDVVNNPETTYAQPEEKYGPKTVNIIEIFDVRYEGEDEDGEPIEVEELVGTYAQRPADDGEAEAFIRGLLALAAPDDEVIYVEEGMPIKKNYYVQGFRVTSHHTVMYEMSSPLTRESE